MAILILSRHHSGIPGLLDQDTVDDGHWLIACFGILPHAVEMEI